MKCLFLRIVIVLSLVGFLESPAQAGKITVPKTGGVSKIIDDLKYEVSRMMAFKNKADSARDDLTTRILGSDGRQTAQNEIDLDVPNALNYRSEAMNDVGFLKDHWDELTAEQRHMVEEAETALE